MSTFLTDDEVIRLTGLRRPSAQARWLASKGIAHYVSASGKVTVTRAAIEPQRTLEEQPRQTPGHLRWESLLVSLDDARQLPRVDSSCDGTGIYFLWHGEHLVYVGKAMYVGQRVDEHRGRKLFTHATWLEVPQIWCRQVEARHVRAYRPPLNRTSSG